MPSVTREALCRAKVCPHPTDPWFHACIICGADAVDHNHVDPRKMGGSKSRDVPENIVMLCRKHHEERTLNKWRDEIRVTGNGRYYLQILGDGPTDRKAYKLGASSATVEVPDGSGADASTVAPGPSAEERVGRDSDENAIRQGWQDNSRPAAMRVVLQPVGEGDAKPQRASAEGMRPMRSEHQGAEAYSFTDNGIEWEPEFTFDDWARAAQRVKTESVGRQWRVGDLVNAERWAECSQFTDDIPYPQETQANYGRVAAAYKLFERAPLPFSYHQAVYKHPDRHTLLEKALANGWTRAELKAEAYPDTRIRIRRFTIEELREAADAYPAIDILEAERVLKRFLDWLAERGSSSESADG